MTNFEFPLASEDQDPEIIKRQESLQILSGFLTGWYKSRDDDSMAAQKARKGNFYLTSDDLERFINEQDYDGYRIKLTIASEEIRAFSFRKGAYDMLYRDVRRLEPGSELILQHANLRAVDDTDRPCPVAFYRQTHELYVGDARGSIPISTLARTLSEGSVLEIEPRDPPPEVSQN